MESQTPPGSKPPDEQTPTDATWISPRLRQKLEGPGPDAPREGPPPWVVIVLAVLVIGGGSALIWAMRTGAAREAAEKTRRAEQAAAAARAESLVTAARMDSMRVVAAARAREDSIAAARSGRRAGPAADGAAGSATASSSAASGSEAAAEAEPRVVERGPFGLDVGSFLVEDRAQSEQERLSSATGLKGKVVTRSDDGGESYHVVLGSFSTRDAAVKRAESLVARGVVGQAWPVSLAP